MAVDYTMFRAHPTFYRGIKFRSRLEATWAAFFDQVGWPWEYEPFDLKGWVPDFLLKGNGRDVLVEVKPVDGTDPDVQNKISSAAKGYDAHLMICGRQPVFHEQIIASLWNWCDCGKVHGWRCGWSCRGIVRATDTNQYDIVFGHWDVENLLTGFRSGRRAGEGGFPLDEFMGREVATLWARAKNATQWRGPR